MSPTEHKFIDDIPETISRVLAGEIRGSRCGPHTIAGDDARGIFVSNGVALEIVRRMRDGMTR
jgi:hypothetical protein